MLLRNVITISSVKKKIKNPTPKVLIMIDIFYNNRVPRCRITRERRRTCTYLLHKFSIPAGLCTRAKSPYGSSCIVTRSPVHRILPNYLSTLQATTPCYKAQYTYVNLGLILSGLLRINHYDRYA